MKQNIRLAVLASSIAPVSMLHGAILVNTPGTFGYSQNFNTPTYATEVATAGTGTPITWSWTNNSTYAGWTRQVSSGGSTNRADKDFIGEFLGGTIRFGNMGSSTAASTDRTLGVVMQGADGSASFGLVFEVANGLGVNGVNFSYTGEQWFRAPSAVGPDKMDFQYKILSAYNASTFLINDETGWTDANTLDFLALKEGTGLKISGNFDGDANFTANRVALSDTIALSAATGEFIAFRWNYISDNANQQAGLGVDDVSITFTTIPEPSSALLGLLGAAAFLLRRSRR